jgi:WD40 repeat protein
LSVWNVREQRLAFAVAAHRERIWALAFGNQGKTLASGSWDGDLKLWDTESRKLTRTFQTGAGITGVAFSGDGRTLISGHTDGRLRLWNLVVNELVASLAAHEGMVQGITMSPDGRQLVSSGSDGTVRLWTAPTLQEIAFAEHGR